MHTPSSYRRAAQQAWSIFLERHSTVASNDARRSALERFLRQRSEATNADLDELTCSGLTFLSRVDDAMEEQ
jgi:hypothetical protein